MEKLKGQMMRSDYKYEPGQIAWARGVVVEHRVGEDVYLEFKNEGSVGVTIARVHPDQVRPTSELAGDKELAEAMDKIMMTLAPKQGQPFKEVTWELFGEILKIRNAALGVKVG
jgi:hypothetical protein